MDTSPDAPTVEAQESDPDSLLNTVRAILAMRHTEQDLQADADLHIISSDVNKPLVYQRGSLLCVLNTTGGRLETILTADIIRDLHGEVLFKIGEAYIENGKVYADAQSFAVIK